LHVAHCDFGLGQRLAVGTAGRGRFPVRERLDVESGLELRGEVLVALDHFFYIVAIEIGALFLRQLVGDLPVLVVELSRPFDRLS
jgi:hypothetical protein